MGALGIPILLGPALGPIISGWLVEYADWRLIFLINVPVGIVAVFVAFRALPSMEAQQTPGPLDTVGAIFGPLAFAALSYGISRSSADTWTGKTTLLGIGIGLVALAIFVVRELRTAHPLLELRVFRSIDFSLTILTQWIIFAVLMGALFLLPLFLQQVRHYGAFDTGLYLLPNALTAAVFMPIGGILFDRLGIRVPALLGIVLVVASTFFLTRISGSTTGTDFLPILAVMGAGLGLMMMPLNTHLLGVAPRDLVSRVTSLSTALQNVVASLAIAGLATILQNRVSEHMPARNGAGAHNPLVVLNAAAHGFADTMLVAFILGIIAILLVMTLRPRPAEGVEALPMA
jgi:EmrB/QacA subfamily drug resistance transporter